MKTTTLKRILALALAMLMTVCVFSGCEKKQYDEDGNEIEVVDKGAEINAYIADFPFDLDPGRIQYDSEFSKYFSLIYEPLFTVDDNGKLHGALANKWEYEEDERDGKLKLVIKLKSTSWSDGIAVDADDVVFTFKRILAPETNNPAAALLYPIENAKDAKSGLCTIDDVGFSAINSSTVEIVFEEEFTDVEYFLRTLSNPVFTPLREDVLSTYGDDWAQAMFVKKQRDGDDTVNSIVTNGPFLVKEWTKDFLMLERSSYYRNLNPEQKFTKYVTPYRIILNFANDADTQLENYKLKKEKDRVFFISSFTKDGYEQNAKKIDTYADGSLYTYYFNANNELLSDANVRKALSIALDRNEIAALVGCGVEAATGFVPTGVEADGKGKKEYRAKAGEAFSASANLEEAKALLKKAGVKKGEVTLVIRNTNDWEYDVADYVRGVWKQLGITTKIDKVGTKSTKTSELSEFEAKLVAGDFDVIGLDMVALSTDAYSFLVPYAREFSGSVVPVDDDAVPSTPHITGFDDAGYNQLMLGEITYDEDGEVETATGILGAEDAGDRYAIYRAAEQILVEQYPSAPLLFGVNNYLVSGKLSKVEYNFNAAPVLTKTKFSGYKAFKVSDIADELEANKK